MGTFNELQHQFRDFAEFHRNEPVRVECYAQGDGGGVWRAICQKQVYGGKQETHKQLWPNADTKPGAPKIAGYESVEVWGESMEAIDHFTDLARKTGAMLPTLQLDQYGIDRDALAELRWVLWAIRTLDGMKPPYAERDDTRAILRDAFNASAVAIDKAGLVKAASQPRATRREQTQGKIARAMVLAKEHPEWSTRQIATEVGVSHSTLSRDKTYQRAIGLMREQGYRIPKGYYDGKTGSMDAKARD